MIKSFCFTLFSFIVQFGLLCQSSIVDNYEITKHDGIGERYINHDLGITLDYTNPVYIADFSDSLKWEMDFYRVDSIPKLDQQVLTHFHWPENISKMRLLYYSSDSTLDEYYKSVKEVYLNEYTPIEIRESKLATLPSNKWFCIEFFDNYSGKNYTSWEFFYKTPKSGGVIRYNYFSPRERQPIEFAVRNGMDQIMSLISLEQERFVENPLGYLQNSLLQNDFYPYETLYGWDRFSDPVKEYSSEVYEYLSFLYSLSGNFKKNREAIMLYRDDNSGMKVNSAHNVVKANEYILSEAKRASILNLSEDHYYPRARNFITSQLKTLYNLGYRVIALEALSGKSGKDYYELGDIKRGIGYYTNEFNYANLLREAKRVGFKIVSYETPAGKAVGTKRDLNSFSNIQKIISHELSKNDKLLIVSGHDHSSKQPGQGYGNTLGTYLFNEYGEKYVSIKTDQYKELDQNSFQHIQSNLKSDDNMGKEKSLSLIHI